jgi:hypothetical protein
VLIDAKIVETHNTTFNTSNLNFAQYNETLGQDPNFHSFGIPLRMFEDGSLSLNREMLRSTEPSKVELYWKSIAVLFITISQLASLGNGDDLYVKLNHDHPIIIIYSQFPPQLYLISG